MKKTLNQKKRSGFLFSSTGVTYTSLPLPIRAFAYFCFNPKSLYPFAHNLLIRTIITKIFVLFKSQ